MFESRKLLILSNVVLGLAVLFLIFSPRTKASLGSGVLRDPNNQYKFTNPILDYEDVGMGSVSILYESVQSKMKELEKQNNVSFSSVYFRDLNNGQWIGVHEKEPFASASLIKIPILISLFREKEANNPSILSKRVVVTPADVAGVAKQNIKPDSALMVGQSYTVLEVAESMIQDSDNVAMKILLNNIDDTYRTGIFGSIGVKFEEENNDVMVRVKDYAGFFRVLFNASYLNREDSEQALEVLSKTKFDKGLVAGVPSGTVVAHKFGERSNYINGILVNKQLHDCGIIYYPKIPYILCVMTRGTDYDSLERFIQEVSNFFYTEVDKRVVL